MQKEIRTRVKYANTAAEIWKDLHERFGKESAPRTYEIKQSITMTRQEESTVSAYYTKLRGLWDEIDTVLLVPRCECEGCTCDIGKKLVELKEKEILYEVLMGLNSDFAVIRTQILAMKPTLTLGVAYHLVVEDEKQRNITAGKKTSTETMAFQATQ
ncbi:putative retrotransposon gag domain-containing protein [Helianthus annuus]|uniref:Retrotransposon gag domain-containing protein n=1 Tax=Helianthus annuus TaxID=4232 RepID=A0A9K3HVG1_HELAN|nr:putative retrotransposon gag domain-containing protein [Helianthus annuus]